MNALPPALALHHIGKRYGALHVLHDVSLELRPGETLGLIGPNGAGKTTLFNIITGFAQPDGGRIHMQGRDVTQATPQARTRLGMVRTFQKSMVFATLNVRENIALAVRQQAGSGMRWRGGQRACRQANALVDALLADTPLRALGETPAQNLPHGLQRMLDVLIALAQQPRILLLDEPTAGLSTAEADLLLDLVQRRAPQAAIMLIAHDLDVVFSRCQRIAVLDLGHLLCTGTPGAVRMHPQVQAAWLGDNSTTAGLAA